MITKGRHPGGLNKLTMPDNMNPGSGKEYHMREEIEEASSNHDKKEYLQTCNTPPLKEPLLSDLRLRGDGPEVKNTLR